MKLDKKLTKKDTILNSINSEIAIFLTHFFYDNLIDNNKLRYNHKYFGTSHEIVENLSLCLIKLI